MAPVRTSISRTGHIFRNLGGQDFRNRHKTKEGGGAGSSDLRTLVPCVVGKVGSVTYGMWMRSSSRSAANVIIFGRR